MSAPTTLRAMVPERGIVILYKPGEASTCPACSGTSWHIGRANAECASCGWAADIATPQQETTLEGEAA